MLVHELYQAEKKEQEERDAFERYQHHREKDAQFRWAVEERHRMRGREDMVRLPMLREWESGLRGGVMDEYGRRGGYLERREQMAMPREYGGRVEERMGSTYRMEEVRPMRYQPVHHGYARTGGLREQSRSAFGSRDRRMVPRDRYGDDRHGIVPMRRGPASRGFADERYGRRDYSGEDFERRGVNGGHQLVRREGSSGRPRSYSEVYEERVQPGGHGFNPRIVPAPPGPRPRGYRPPPRGLEGW
jgi:hypothetical protein